MVRLNSAREYAEVRAVLFVMNAIASKEQSRTVIYEFNQRSAMLAELQELL